MKAVHMIAAPGGVFALTDDGGIYFGFFIEQGPFRKPKWGWRKVPAIPESKNAFTFERLVEPSEKELDEARKAFEENNRKEKLKELVKSMDENGC